MIQKYINDGWVIANWCESKECECEIISKIGKLNRCIISEFSEIKGTEICFACNRVAKSTILLAKSY